MSSRIPFSLDPRMHREEEWTVARLNGQPKQNGTASQQNGHASRSCHDLPGLKPAEDGTTPAHRRFVFTDPVAFRYLEEDPATVVLERRRRLQGYELYLVEQWACSRVHPTFVITTYTGDPSHSVLVGVLAVPANESSWSPRLRVYFKAILQYHARPKDTPLGSLWVTNLSGFPSALTVIPVPDGDVRKHREDFIVNEDLKRLGCSGRSGLSLSAPAGATQAKFHQLYKTSDRIPLYASVIELVKLCQVALIIFGKLEQEYADGLLCDVTEKAINDWWTEIGSEYYNLEPNDGILGPTTVAALLGLLMGARNRLNYYGAPVAKDVFDITSLKRGIAYFQKSQKLERTRRLDQKTLSTLHRVTAKAAAGEKWQVSKSVKSTVAELGGRGGEMVMGMVGAKEKPGIAEIETLDLERFISLVHGSRSKWLWYGKTRRTGTVETTFGKSLPEMGNMIFSRDDQGGYLWSRKNGTESFPPEDDQELYRKESATNSIYANKPPESAVSMVDSAVEKDPQLRKAMFKSVQGKVGDARSGFERFKDNMRLRGHASRHSKDDTQEADGILSNLFSPIASATTLDPGSALSPSSTNVSKAFSWKTKPEEYQNGFPKSRDNLLINSANGQLRDTESPPSEPRLSVPNSADILHSEAALKEAEADAKWSAQVKEIRRDLIANESSLAGSTYGGDLEGPVLGAERDPDSAEGLLFRRNSVSDIRLSRRRWRDDAWYARHLSFSEVEEAVLTWEDIGLPPDEEAEGDNFEALKREKLKTEDLKVVYDHISLLQEQVVDWVKEKVNMIKDLDNQATQDQDEYQTLYYQLSEAYQTVLQSSKDLVGEERSHVMEAIKDIDVLVAKLEYEINSLVSKVEDVEEGVTQFEGQVNDLEARADELGEEMKKESWLHWVVRNLTGMGTGPHPG